MRTRSLGFVLASLSCASSVYASSSWDIHDYPYPDHRFKSHAVARSIQRRNIVADSDVQNSYDFIIIGGGTAGLTIASRLSEDSNHTVLVLEAGDTGDAVRSTIDTPGDTYYAGLMGSSYDWSYSTVPQTSAAGQSIKWPRGKVLGGSSAVNGLYSVRASKIEHDAWAALQGNADGANAWNWDTQFEQYKKAETFSAPDSGLASTFSLEYGADSHGTSGPVDVSWPAFQLPIVSNWSATLGAVGIPTNQDPYGGSNTGAFIALSTINPANATRSYARSAYIDPLPYRSNLAILANAQVTQIVFSSTKDSDGNVTATGVTYQLVNATSTRTISVNKEVILCGGAVGSPQVLMLSGVGPSDVLSAAGVPSVVSLPGVGQHMQDHIATGISWSTSAQTYASIRDSGDTDPTFLSYVNGAEAYINLTTLFGSDQANTYQQQAASAIDSNAETHVPSSDPTVVAGYKALQHTVTDTFMLSELAHVELLLSAQGQKGVTTGQSIMIQCALQHPLSAGRLYINSSDPFAYPLIDPANTCSMLPLSLGGVVSPKLKVYGTSNVRVADASVIPVSFASHLMMSVYALAETASEIIRAEYNGGLAPGETASSTASPAESTGTTSSDKNGAGLSHVPPRAIAIVLALSALSALLA